MEQKEKAECIDDSDREALAAAIDALREPQAVMNFLRTFLQKKYNLGPEDKLDSRSGVIIRLIPS